MTKLAVAQLNTPFGTTLSPNTTMRVIIAVKLSTGISGTSEPRMSSAMVKQRFARLFGTHKTNYCGPVFQRTRDSRVDGRASRGSRAAGLRLNRGENVSHLYSGCEGNAFSYNISGIHANRPAPWRPHMVDVNGNGRC